MVEASLSRSWLTPILPPSQSTALVATIRRRSPFHLLLWSMELVAQNAEGRELSRVDKSPDCGFQSIKAIKLYHPILCFHSGIKWNKIEFSGSFICNPGFKQQCTFGYNYITVSCGADFLIQLDQVACCSQQFLCLLVVARFFLKSQKA